MQSDRWEMEKNKGSQISKKKNHRLTGKIKLKTEGIMWDHV